MRALIVLALLTAGCGGGLMPAALDTHNEQCATCRMVVASPRTASQIVAREQEPKFFDDLGCLDQFLAASPLRDGARVFVADRGTGEWIAAESAFFARAAAPAGAMGSYFVAYGSAAARDRDTGAVAVPTSTAVPSLTLPGGPR